MVRSIDKCSPIYREAFIEMIELLAYIDNLGWSLKDMQVIYHFMSCPEWELH